MWNWNNFWFQSKVAQEKKISLGGGGGGPGEKKIKVDENIQLIFTPIAGEVFRPPIEVYFQAYCKRNKQKAAITRWQSKL